MSMNDREVVEAIRQLVLRTQPDHMVVTEVAHEFARTVSRLNEMQSAAFLAMDRRHVDTRLT